MTTTISRKGQIVLPAKIRQQDGIEAGQKFEVERIARGEYRLVRRQSRANEGLIAWLLSCPEKDFLVPIESPVRPRLNPEKTEGSHSNRKP